jgi:hypothetical protein
MKSHPQKFLILLLLALLGTSLLTAPLSPPVSAAALPQERKMDEAAFFPLISFTEHTEPTRSPADDLADLIINHPEQVRPAMYKNAILTQVAQDKAEDMARRSYFGHVTPEGFGPNYLVEQAGYALPDWYGQELDCNNIESLAGGFATPEDVLKSLLVSDMHRKHLLGTSWFFAEQLDYGIGYVYAPGSDFGYYWVILTGRH